MCHISKFGDGWQQIGVIPRRASMDDDEHRQRRIAEPPHESSTPLTLTTSPSVTAYSLVVTVDSGSVRKSWRRLLRGPRHGIARGTAIYGSRGFKHDPDHAAVLSGCRGLRGWARGQQINLDDHPASLAALDQASTRSETERCQY
jgi:hypothetical protein